MMDTNLPLGWSSASLGELLEFKYGKALPEKSRSGSGLPVYGSNGIVGAHFEALTCGPTIVIGRKGSVGAVQLSWGPCSPIDTTYYVDQVPDGQFPFWFHKLRSLDLPSLNKATAIPGINREDAYKLSIQVPPAAEQKRIADKLDTVLARVDAVNDRLARVAPLLKRFRQSVLAAATSGRLTADWRENTSFGLTAHGVGTDTPARSSLPLERLSSISDVIDPNPKHRNPIYQVDGELFLSTTNFAEGDRWNLGSAKRVSKDTVLEQQARCKFTKESLVFSRKGTIGKVRMVPPIDSFALLDSLVVINAKAGLNSRFLLFALQSPVVQEQVVRLTRGVALKQVSVGVVRSLEIPLPGVDEQTEIVRRVDLLFAFADRLEARLQAAQTASARLTPALLAKAFRGELVPQDPNDEPAAELLKRLAQSKPAMPTKGRKRQAA